MLLAPQYDLLEVIAQLGLGMGFSSPGTG